MTEIVAAFARASLRTKPQEAGTETASMRYFPYWKADRSTCGMAFP
jgi:hypothetical protein